MTAPFEDIVVTDFTVSEADQDSEKSGLFHFRFRLSRPAPQEWVQIADMDLGGGGRASFALLRKASANSHEIVVRCAHHEAQGVKNNLNAQVLPGVNQEYRRATAAAEVRQSAANARQRQLLSEVEKVIREQT